MDAVPLNYRQCRYIGGLDIGQMSDSTALTVIQRDIFLDKGAVRSRYDARWLERFPLQTSYPNLAQLVRDRLERLGEQIVLVVDVTGVGRGMVDLLREEWMSTDKETGARLVHPGKPALVAVTLLTSAMHQPTSPAWDEHHVPKRDVVMRFMVALQQQRFRAAKGLKEAEVLFKEGRNFQWKVTAAGNDQYGAWREGQHDDLLLAVALAVWWGEVYGGLPLGVTSREQQYATPAASPHRPRGQGQGQAQGARVGWRR